MASEQTFSTADLRSGAKDFKRDKDHRSKWAHGAEFSVGRRPEDNKPRPVRITQRPSDLQLGPPKGRNGNKGKNDMAYLSADSSADEDVDEPCAAPVPDAEITYSFDAVKGPSHGSQILGLALTAAIERYEVRQTDKLIKEEYEVLDAGEALGDGPSHAPKTISGVEEDYEFVEA